MPDQLVFHGFLHIAVITRLKYIFACIFNIGYCICIALPVVCRFTETKITLQGDCMISMCGSGEKESRLEYLRMVAMFHIRQPE